MVRPCASRMRGGDELWDEQRWYVKVEEAVKSLEIISVQPRVSDQMTGHGMYTREREAATGRQRGRRVQLGGPMWGLGFECRVSGLFGVTVSEEGWRMSGLIR